MKVIWRGEFIVPFFIMPNFNFISYTSLYIVITINLPLHRMHLSTVWRTALLSASRQLRQDLLKGRIYVDSSSPAPSRIIDSAPASPSPGPAKGDTDVIDRDSYVSRHWSRPNSPSSAPCSMPEFGLPYDYEDGLPTTIIDSHPNRPNEGYHSDSSNSSIDLSFASNLAIPISQRSGSSAGGSGRKYKYRTVGRSSGKMKGKGRDRGMGESWERSGSESEGGGGTSGDLRPA